MCHFKFDKRAKCKDIFVYTSHDSHNTGQDTILRIILCETFIEMKGIILMLLTSLHVICIPLHLSKDKLEGGDYDISLSSAVITQRVWEFVVQSGLKSDLVRQYSSLLHFLSTIHRTVKELFIQCFSISREIKPLTPCGRFLLQTVLKQSNCILYFQINVGFVFNITIQQSHVAYSVNCSTGYIEVFEGFSVIQHALLSQFCGHILMETVYTRQNKALVKILTGTHLVTTINVAKPGGSAQLAHAPWRSSGAAPGSGGRIAGV